MFLRVLVQVRGKSLSVDVNEAPIFTNVRLSSGEAFDGLPGFCAEVLSSIFPMPYHNMSKTNTFREGDSQSSSGASAESSAFIATTVLHKQNCFPQPLRDQSRHLKYLILLSWLLRKESPSQAPNLGDYDGPPLCSRP